MMLTHLSLFSGIGGLDLAAEWAGFSTVAFVERDKFCQRVLAKHWPGVPIFDDVAEVGADTAFAGCETWNGDRLRTNARHQQRSAPRSPSEIYLLTGGFPCQPHSVAGKRRASSDERDLWHECARITAELRPRWCVFENVPGLLTSEGGTFFARVLGDLAALGYRVGWGVWGAADVGAPHRRERVFIVAHVPESDAERRRRWEDDEGAAPTKRERHSQAGDVAHSGSDGRLRERLEEHPEQQGASRNQPDGLGEGRWREGEDVADATEPRRARNGRRDEGGEIRNEARRPESSRRGEDVAHAAISGMEGYGRCGESSSPRSGQRDDVGKGGGDGASAWHSDPTGECWLAEPKVGRVAHGISRRVDRLRALGNAVVPQQAYPLFKAIADHEMSQPCA